MRVKDRCLKGGASKKNKYSVEDREKEIQKNKTKIEIKTEA